MKSLLIAALLLPTLAMATNCYEGRTLSDDVVLDIEGLLGLKEADLKQMTETFELMRKSVDMNDNRAVARWSMVTGYEAYQYISMQQRSIRYHTSCDVEAQKFFECRPLEEAYVEAIVNFRKEYLKFDFSNNEDQRRWQTTAPALQFVVDQAFYNFNTCSR